jgi:hypothetical protein
MGKTKVSLDAGTISQKWNANMKSNVSNIVKAINNVTVNPAEKAAANIDKMVAGVQAAAADGRIARGLSNVTLAGWKQVTAAKVQARLPSGVDAAMPKRQKFDQYMVQTLNNVLPEIDAMPHNTIDDGIAKVSKLAHYLHDNRFKAS